MSREAKAWTSEVEPRAVCGVPRYAVDASSALPSDPTSKFQPAAWRCAPSTSRCMSLVVENNRDRAMVAQARKAPATSPIKSYQRLAVAQAPL